jgi:hypothetical protein
MREPGVFGPLQRLAQLGRLTGQHRDHLVHIPVSGGPGDPVVTGQRLAGGAVAEPPQPQHRLPKAAQRPAPLGGAAPPPLGQQQPGNEPGQFPGNVKRRTIGDHVEPSQKLILW